MYMYILIGLTIILNNHCIIFKIYMYLLGLVLNMCGKCWDDGDLQRRYPGPFFVYYHKKKKRLKT